MPDDEQNQDSAANADLIASGPRWSWPRPGRRVLIVLAGVAGTLLLTAGGIALAGYDYSRDYEGQILPGATIAGVEVGGLTATQALERVKAAVRPELHRTLTVNWKQRSWEVTPKELGARSNARRAVRAALAASEETSFLHKVKMRVLGHRLRFERDVAIRYPRQGVRGFVEGVAASVDLDPRDAALDYSSGWVEIVPEADGRRVEVKKARRQLLGALRTGGSYLTLPVERVEPTVTTANFDQVLLVRIGENRLYLYEDGVITDEWPVATGLPEYPTPTGQFYVTEKRYMPTWVNPDPTGWGSDMPLQIPPGPSNPLGTRAINWSADGIRFHGTTADYSIGYNASHGCVRMYMSDVEALYDMIDVGTPIVSVFAGSWNPLGATSGDSIRAEGG